MTPDFEDKLEQYIRAITLAHDGKESESKISHAFLSFISDAFGVSYEDIKLEQSITMSKVEKRGYVDALFGDLVIEFKRNIKTKLDENIEQLTNYMREMPQLTRYVGMLTDGIRFRTYVLDEFGESHEVSKFTITDATARASYLWLDTYLFSRSEIEPTADDIVQRFGIDSPAFSLAHHRLRSLLEKAEKHSELDVWRGQWRGLLSKVYGSDIADNELFLRHSYLSQFAKILVFAALEGRPARSDIPRIVSGVAFHRFGVSNIGENDFFAWVMMPDLVNEAVDFLHALSAELQVYDLSVIRQDLLKQLYQNLVDPKTRHDLGEYYTPDWLAQLTLEEIDYDAPQSLLDPACGSGTFLFNAIRRLIEKGMSGRRLVEFVLNNIIGVDVHPLAVTIARINVLLALSEHIEVNHDNGEVPPLPVFLADALIRPLEDRSPDSVTIAVSWEANEVFHIPIESATDADKLTRTIDYMDRLAKTAATPEQVTQLTEVFRMLVQDFYTSLTNPTFHNLWASNFHLLAQLIREGRDTIWAYILKNLSRPLVLAEKGFDVVVGNPPWLAYRYVNSPAWQDELKSLFIYYRLIDSAAVKLFTQMDLSTLFYTHAKDRYLKDDGTLAFVMPRSVLTGAKQHRPFQRQGMTRILDVGDVSPLFNVPSAVLIQENGEVAKHEIPTRTYSGRFDKHELPLTEAQPLLTVGETTTSFVDEDIRCIYYYELFAQGASLVPRNLCFVRPALYPNNPIVITDPELDKDAKEPWKGFKLEGQVSYAHAYATLLSKHLLPFGYQQLNMVALPFKINELGKLEEVDGLLAFAIAGRLYDYQHWFERIEKVWEQRKKSDMTLAERYDYHSLLTKQNPKDRFRVMYGGSGSNIACCVLDEDMDDLHVYERRVQGIVADSTCYHYTAPTLEEAHYLCAVLNSEIVNQEIKAHQPEGLWGARHIQRTPFEACAIPIYETDNPDHWRLARLSIEAHERIEDMKGMDENQLLNGRAGRARARAREILADEISAMDEIVRRLITV